MANNTVVFHAVSQALDTCVSALHGPFLVLRCTLEDSENFVDWGSTHASQQAEMLTLNRETREKAACQWGGYQILMTRKGDAYQSQDEESWRCQKEMDMSQSNYLGYARYQNMIAPWGPAFVPGWSKNGASFTK
jgi:hypothetical protein